MTRTVVDIRLILKHALELNSTSIVLSHNNPSGILILSEADIKVAGKIDTGSTKSCHYFICN